MPRSKRDPRCNKAGSMVVTDKEKLSTKIIIGKTKAHAEKIINESKELLKQVGIKLRNANIPFNINMEYSKEGIREGFEIKN